MNEWLKCSWLKVMAKQLEQFKVLIVSDKRIK